MPKLVRLYVRHTAIGFGIAALFVGLLLWFDVAGLWRLISNSDMGLLAGFLLFLFNGIVFSGAQFGIAVMSMSEDDTQDRGKRQRHDPPSVAVPASLPVRR